MSFIRIARIAAALALSTLSTWAQAANTENADILGIWKLTKVLDYAEVAAMDDDQAAKLVGKTLVVKNGGIIFAGEPCQNSDLERHREPTAKYVRENYHAAAGRLGLPAKVTVVHLTCTEAFLKAPNKIVVFWDGFFFDAIKQSASKPGRLAKR